ncbi:AraC family transcriptional regulator [Caulobacter sp. NIBR2454]|uniref:AraC family transcriptional regulator n=1 Tax=Caulobacter sp. NIBR2454 TaxID=3015996 RepID=UPI0022B74774|nr:AraC family transcriptional regulator [Caulobacter sp. NIBR2454]
MAADADNWVFRSSGGIDRIEARLNGTAFAPHRHDTYAIGITIAGVQTFDYRGAARHSLPGQMVVLHPDELHDGRAGDGMPFQYRTAYVAPADIQRVLGGRALPFIQDGVSDDPRLRRVVSELLDDLDRPLDSLEYEQAVTDITTALLQAAGIEPPRNRANHAAVLRARDFIEANLEGAPTLADLEQAAQQDRWGLSRDFRALLGSSPYRYLIFRRLDRAREMMGKGAELADVAQASGFADQSHFTRLFKKAYGMTPRTWVATHRRSRSD